MLELWRPIPGFSNYEVSSLGRVRNINGYILKPWNGYGKNGRYYKKVGLYSNGKRVAMFIHRLVFFSFYEIDHKDRDRSNNTLANLEAVTRRENDSRWRKNTEEVPF